MYEATVLAVVQVGICIESQMLIVEQYGSRGPLVLMVHWLGGSSRTWTEVGAGLASHGMRCVAVDLPGFGRAALSQEFSIAAMVEELAATVRSLRGEDVDTPWFLAGHSMGGKLSAIVARAAEDGAPGLEHLGGVVLLSPSPPGPEPMQESKRAEMLHALGPKTVEAAKRRENAETFVDDNTGKLPLLESVHTRTVEDVVRMNPDALVAWLTTGSKENWAAHVGRLTTPAMVMAGTEEAALNPGVQKTDTLPHFANVTLAGLEGGGHIAPLERPAEVVDRMLEFFRKLGVAGALGEAALGDDFLALIESERTSSQTREALLKRVRTEPSKTDLFLPGELRTLRALATCVVPGAGFDLAARVVDELDQGKGDGWRFASLPNDVDAWKIGLFSLDAAAMREFGVPFVALDAARQDEMLRRAQAGELGEGLLGALHIGTSAGAFNAAQMREWFEEVRGGLARLYVADPRTMERIGFTGFADEGGFTQIRMGEREEFER